MKMFLGDKGSNTDRQINATELKVVFDTLKGDPDGGDVEMVVLSHIDQSGNLYFDIEKYSTFGG